MATRIDLELPSGDALDVVFSLTQRQADGSYAPFDLTGAEAVVLEASVVGGAVTYSVGSGVTVVSATTGVVRVRLDGDDFPASGIFPWRLTVLPASATDPETALYGSLEVVDFLDPRLLELRRILGDGVPPTNAQLLEALGRLGSVKAVALEELERVLLRMATQPTSWSTDGYSESWAANLPALREYVRNLRAEVAGAAGTGGDRLTVAKLTRVSGRR